MERTAEKQKIVEQGLAGLGNAKPGKIEGVENKLRSGTYRKDRSLRSQNRETILKEQRRLSRKINSGKSSQIAADKKKVKKLGNLVTIIDDETNVEDQIETVNAKESPSEPVETFPAITTSSNSEETTTTIPVEEPTTTSVFQENGSIVAENFENVNTEVPGRDNSTSVYMKEIEKLEKNSKNINKKH
jgi:hypothetical protein